MKAVFGYGSLVDVASATATLCREVLPLYVKLYGHRRVFNATWDGYNNSTKLAKHFFVEGTKNDDIPLLPIFQLTYLNVEQEVNSNMVGILIPVTDEELKKFDSRESMKYDDEEYRRIEVTQLCEGLPDYIDEVYIYSVIKPSPTIKSRIASTYYDLCEAAHKSTPELFNSWTEDMKHTTIKIIRTDLNIDKY